jgi:hypothetical protein
LCAEEQSFQNLSKCHFKMDITREASRCASLKVAPLGPSALLAVANLRTNRLLNRVCDPVGLPIDFIRFSSFD